MSKHIEETRVEYDYTTEVECHVFQLKDGEKTTADIVNVEGEHQGTITVQMENGTPKVISVMDGSAKKLKEYTIRKH